MKKITYQAANLMQVEVKNLPYQPIHFWDIVMNHETDA
jgi:hypothetical protein